MDSLLRTGGMLMNSIAPWVAFIITLMIFSALIGDNALSRFAQHILIGAGLGYAGVLAIQYVLMPQLLMPILTGQADWQAVWLPFGMGIVLLIAGMDRIVLQSRAERGRLRVWRRALQGAGRLVVALLLGIGLGAGIMGSLQGTIIPQYLRAAEAGMQSETVISGPLVGIFTLLLTTATLLHLFVDPQRHLAEQPSYARRFMMGWIWIGQRALWFASGLIFARLVASRLSLLISRVEFVAEFVQNVP